MLNFEHESLESHESFILKPLIRLIREIRVPKKTIRNSCSVKTVRNSRAEKYLLELCFVNMILSHRNHDT